MDFKDYYKVLGVDKSATDKEIKNAYRRLARRYHPDVNRGDASAEERFKEINEANQVLSDPENRKKYDQLGANWKEYERWQQAGGRGQPFDASGFGFGGPGDGNVRYEYHTVSEEDLKNLFGGGGGAPFSDFFSTFFAGSPGATAGRAPRPRQGRDLEHPVEITLAEAYRGATRLLRWTDETGAVKQVEARIPAGVAGGTRIRLAGRGEPGTQGGPPGDLFLLVKVLPDPNFRREGDNLRSRVSVPLVTAVLGGEVEVPTPEGKKLALKVPPETQNGQVFRLRGKGMPRMGRTREWGDLLAEVHVVLPKNLSQREKELFQELARSGDAEPAAAH